MCDASTDPELQLLYCLHPVRIVYETRRLLTSPLHETSKDLGPSGAKESAKIILSCARAVYHSLNLPGLDLDVNAFREDICRRSIPNAKFEPSSSRGRELSQALLGQVDYAEFLKRDGRDIPKHAPVMATLIREWMLVVIVITSTIIDPLAAIFEVQPSPAYTESPISSTSPGQDAPVYKQMSGENGPSSSLEEDNTE